MINVADSRSQLAACAAGATSGSPAQVCIPDIQLEEWRRPQAKRRRDWIADYLGAVKEPAESESC